MFNDKEEFKFEGEIIETPEDELFTQTFPPNSKIDKWQDKEKLNYPFFLNAIINRLNEGFAPIIVICGQERIGKSTMAVDIAWKLTECNAVSTDLDKERIKELLAYEPETFLEIITEEDRQPILIDEAGVVAGSKDFQTVENRIINKVIQTMGYKQNVYIFILPDFMALDKKIRNKVDIKIELYDRGKAKVTGINTNFGKMRTNEFDFYKQPLPTYWMSDFDEENQRFEDDDKHEVMKGYDEKEKEFKQDNAEDMLQELKGDSDDSSDIDFDDIDID